MSQRLSSSAGSESCRLPEGVSLSQNGGPALAKGIRPCRLEGARVEDELARRPRAARLWARRRRGGLPVLGVRAVDARQIGRGTRLLAGQLAGADEPGELLHPRARARPRAVEDAAVVGGVLAEVGGVGARRAEVDDVANFRVARDPLAAPLGAAPGESVSGSRAEAGGSGGGLVGDLGLLGRGNAVLHRFTSRDAGEAMRGDP